MTAISIVPLAQTSQPQWHALWAGYQAFYQTKLSDELSAHTWQRLTSAESAHMYGFAALFEQQMVGFVHVIEHDSCWTFKPYAYLQDFLLEFIATDKTFCCSNETINAWMLFIDPVYIE